MRASLHLTSPTPLFPPPLDTYTPSPRCPTLTPSLEPSRRPSRPLALSLRLCLLRARVLHLLGQRVRLAPHARSALLNFMVFAEDFTCKVPAGHESEGSKSSNGWRKREEERK